jgi:hypothetical protein
MGKPRLDRVRSPAKNLDEYPSPYLSGVMEIDEVIRGAYVQTSRGCPFNCAYCDYGRSRPFGEFSLDRVGAEIDFFKREGAEKLLFVDSTFNLNNERGIQILDYTVACSLQAALWIEAHPNLLDRRFMEAVGRTHCIYLGLGIQTTNPVAMKNINRIWDPEKIGALLDDLAVNKSCMLCLEIIMGLPGDDLQAFRDSLTWIYEREVTRTQALVLQVLPQTQLHREAERFGIVEGGPLAGHHIVSTSTFPANQIQVGKTMTDWNRQMQPVFYRLVRLTGRPAGYLIERWTWTAYEEGIYDIITELHSNQINMEFLDWMALLFGEYAKEVFLDAGLPDVSDPLKEFMRYYYMRRSVTSESIDFIDAMDVNCITLDPKHNVILKKEMRNSLPHPLDGRAAAFTYDMARVWPLISIEDFLGLEPGTFTYLFFSDERGAAVAMEL